MAYEFKHAATGQARNWLARFQDDPDPAVQEALNNTLGWLIVLDQRAKATVAHQVTGLKLYCNETQQRFESQTEAARVLGLQQGNISKHLKGELRNVGGFTFRYVQPDDNK